MRVRQNAMSVMEGPHFPDIWWFVWHRREPAMVPVFPLESPWTTTTKAQTTRGHVGDARPRFVRPGGGLAQVRPEPVGDFAAVGPACSGGAPWVRDLPDPDEVISQGQADEPLDVAHRAQTHEKVADSSETLMVGRADRGTGRRVGRTCSRTPRGKRRPIRDATDPQSGPGLKLSHRTMRASSNTAPSQRRTNHKPCPGAASGSAGNPPLLKRSHSRAATCAANQAGEQTRCRSCR
jgi:hypothetical protein